MKRTILSLFLALPILLGAQTYRGKVFITDDHGHVHPAVAAAVYWVPAIPGQAVKHMVYTGRFLQYRAGTFGTAGCSLYGLWRGYPGSRFSG